MKTVAAMLQSFFKIFFFNLNHNKMSSDKKVKVEIVKDAYGEYRIGGQLNSQHIVSRELADKMIASGHAVEVKSKDDNK